VANELFHADEQTNMTNLIAVFLNFAKAPKNVTLWSVEKFTTLTEEFDKKKDINTSRVIKIPFISKFNNTEFTKAVVRNEMTI